MAVSRENCCLVHLSKEPRTVINPNHLWVQTPPTTWDNGLRNSIYNKTVAFYGHYTGIRKSLQKKIVKKYRYQERHTEVLPILRCGSDYIKKNV